MRISPTLAIIGPGRTGTAIGVLAARSGYPVTAVGGRQWDRTVAAARRIGEHVHPCSMRDAAKSAGVVLITVSDDAIEQVCDELAARNAFREGAIIAHCSGALDSHILSAARDRCQCLVASMHPLHTFPTVDAAVARLRGTYCFCEGDEKALAVIEGFARHLELKPIRIERTAKVLYHASAVLACNYIVALIDAAISLAEHAGIEPSTAWSAFEPLVLATVKNVAEMGPTQALTGPIARGDVETVRHHLQRIELVDSRLASLYRAIGCHAVNVAIRKGTIASPKTQDIMESLLDHRNSES